MQKVLRRTVLAEAQAARRLAKRKDKYQREARKTARENVRYQDRTVVADIKAERAARREDWELGPLAPRRDVGRKRDTYGTIDAMRMQGPQLSMEERLEVNPSGGRYANIVVGDRVVLLEGKDRGKIGKITASDTRRQEVTVEGLNMMDVAVPSYMLKNEVDKRPVRTLEKPVSVASVRLVYALPDAESGTVRDVIVKKLVNTPIFFDRYTGRRSWKRKIAGMDVVIPWPTVEARVHKDHDCDTLRIDVEAETFIPSLLRTPMPATVINELRNKYSVFRTRHDEDYLEKKRQEDDEKEAKKQLALQMRSPIQEVNRRARKLRKAKGKGKLTRGMLIRIGEVIARRRASAMQAVGLQKEASVA